jgi:hypothetical protein
MQFPGSVTLIGSGETAATGGQVFEIIARQQNERNPNQPLQISVLETPAGFEANAQRVAGRVAEFIETRLQNFQPQVQLVHARKKGTPFSPDTPEIVQPLYASQVIFFGPGSPTYTVRQLENSLAWHVLQSRHRLGAALVLASAATISLGALALPVYEIYKVGEDLHWKPGLDFFKPYGLRLVIIPHWNNREGGDEVDTSRCFMGQKRFDALRAMIPDDITIVGIDEHTALTIDFEAQACHIRGVSQVHVLRDGNEQSCAAGCSYPIQDLGDYHPLDSPVTGLPENVWRQALAAQEALAAQVAQGVLDDTHSTPQPGNLPVPQEVQNLVEERQAARQAKNWVRADQLRDQIANLGWQVKDTSNGPAIQRES